MARLVDIDKLEDPFKGTPQEGNWITTMLAQLLRTAPRADAEYIRHGRWEPYESNSGYAYNWRCSVCKRYHFHNGEMLEKYKYCPNCGAKMDEVTW